MPQVVWYKFCPKLYYLFYIASLEGKTPPLIDAATISKFTIVYIFVSKQTLLSKSCQRTVRKLSPAVCTSPYSLKQPTTYKSRRKQCHGRFLDIFSASLLAQFTESHSSAMCTTTTTTTIVLSGWLIDG